MPFGACQLPTVMKFFSRQWFSESKALDASMMQIIELFDPAVLPEMDFALVLEILPELAQKWVVVRELNCRRTKPRKIRAIRHFQTLPKYFQKTSIYTETMTILPFSRTKPCVLWERRLKPDSSLPRGGHRVLDFKYETQVLSLAPCAENSEFRAVLMRYYEYLAHHIIIIIIASEKEQEAASLGAPKLFARLMAGASRP